MAAAVIISKIIITVNEFGKASASIVQYKVKDGAAVDSNFRTMDVFSALSQEQLAAIVEASIQRVKDGEGTNLVRIRESAAKVRERVQEHINKKKERGSK